MAAWPRDNDRGGKFVVERSPFTSRHVFARGIEDSDLADAYATLYARAEQRCRVDMHVFVSEAPSTCLRRIRKRGQPGDSAVTIDYLRTLDSLHWKCVTRLHGAGKNVFVL